MPILRIRYVALRPRRGSGKVSPHRATESKRRSRSSILPKNPIRLSEESPICYLIQSVAPPPAPPPVRTRDGCVPPLQFNNENCCLTAVFLDRLLYH